MDRKPAHGYIGCWLEVSRGTGGEGAGGGSVKGPGPPAAFSWEHLASAIFYFDPITP